MFMSICAGVLRNLKLPSALHISQVLPVIHMILGKDGSSSFLKCLLDSEAGMNLGKRKYHQRTAKQCPHLVVRYTDFDTEEFDPIAVGGIDGQKWGTDIVACITYRLPWIINGSEAELTFGLANEVICNSILGVQFIERAKMVIDLAGRVATSATLGVTFPLTMEEPRASSTVPEHVQGNEAAVLSTTQG